MAIAISGLELGDLSSYVSNSGITSRETTDSFSDVLSAMMNSVDETNDLQNAAESAEIQFALGESENTHDLLIAETKASIALQYTVKVRDKLVEGYRELMQMQV